MARHDISLDDRFDLQKSQVLLNGTQALVRLVLMQSARDRQAGYATAGLVTGYRGSPLGAVDMQMQRAAGRLTEAHVTFQPGLNEDLAATALWGAQQAELRGEGRYDGVFGLWYGKGPGVDRSGDVMRHANFAGTSPLGGVIMAMGDDHTGESSTTLHQSDWAMVDAYMPILSPAGVQEILDFGLYGWALSRFASVWVGLKTMKDTVEATAVVDGGLDRVQTVIPDLALPEGGLSIRVHDTPQAQEARMVDHKLDAILAFARANPLDRRVWGAPGARIGVVAAGKSYLDMVHALSLLGLDGAEAARLGVTTYKVAQTWPLETEGFRAWARGLDLVVVVEEKRKLIEGQIKDALYGQASPPRVYGWHKGEATENGRRIELFTPKYALDPVDIAIKLGDILIEEGAAPDALPDRLAQLRTAQKAEAAEDIATRLPYFCSGCPHNSSTKLPEGARAYAGIGCHYMVQWMDRDTVGFTHMGGEGANWIGEAPFSTRAHMFQNIGEGTYNHSGIQAIRAAVAAGTTITYKILYNDAVAMTGGQSNDGALSPARIVAELRGIGVGEIAVVYDEKEEVNASEMHGVAMHKRDELNAVQEKLSKISGVTAIVYVQTCAAEKRRRRKRGQFPDPDRRLFINPDVCEGCGDCGVQSNCVSLIPVETPFGRKRAIDQSSCNKDFSCIKGFCPSFLTVEGGTPRKQAAREVAVPDLPEPTLPELAGPYNIVITGIGGTGVVTIGAVLSMAAHVDGRGTGMIEMAGLAQKGGAVHIHCRIAPEPGDITAIRVAAGEADVVLGGDLVVTAGAKTLSLMTPGRSRAVVNSHETLTGDFTRNPELHLPTARMTRALEARLGEDLRLFDAAQVATQLMGDSIYSNMMVLGAAWQNGWVPVSLEAMRTAITLNGAAVTQNLSAFEFGRWFGHDPAGVQSALTPSETAAPQDPIAQREAHLQAYQGRRLVARFRKALARIEDADLRLAVAEGYHKLLTYKDEYEVARLHLASERQARAAFSGDLRVSYHLAPPLLSKMGADGRPEKRQFGPGMARAFRVLARLKLLRGTPFDPFGYTEERRMERALIRQYEAELPRLIAATNTDAALELARLPLTIRGFGPVKAANARKAAETRARLLAELDAPAQTRHAAE